MKKAFFGIFILVALLAVTSAFADGKPGGGDGPGNSVKICGFNLSLDRDLTKPEEGILSLSAAADAMIVDQTDQGVICRDNSGQMYLVNLERNGKPNNDTTFLKVTNDPFANQEVSSNNAGNIAGKGWAVAGAVYNIGPRGSLVEGINLLTSKCAGRLNRSSVKCEASEINSLTKISICSGICSN